MTLGPAHYISETSRERFNSTKPLRTNFFVKPNGVAENGLPGNAWMTRRDPHRPLKIDQRCLPRCENWNSLP